MPLLILALLLLLLPLHQVVLEDFQGNNTYNIISYYNNKRIIDIYSDPFADDPFGSVPGTAANQPTVFEFSDPFSAPVFDTNNTNAPPAKPAKPNKEANLLDF